MWWIAWLIGCNDCSYYARCDGDTLLVCGASVDQLYNREVHRVPCDALNPVCVELGDNDATCAARSEPCDPEAAEACDGSVRTTCEPFRAEDIEGEVFYDEDLPVAYDCARDDQSCVVDEEGLASCM